jgi:drug/metabolite transporter (DMT)-like permease
MAKFTQFQRKSVEKKGMHPIWRGIGCILIIIAPLMSYGLTLLFVPALIATGNVPYQLLGYIHFPAWVYHSKITFGIGSYLSSFSNPWFNIIIFLVILLILTGVGSLLYTYLYSLVGPARYTAVDAPPSKHKPKFFKR